MSKKELKRLAVVLALSAVLGAMEEPRAAFQSLMCYSGHIRSVT